MAAKGKSVVFLGAEICMEREFRATRLGDFAEGGWEIMYYNIKKEEEVED